MSGLFNQFKVQNSKGTKDQSSRLITLSGIKKVYKTDAGEFQALKGIDLEIDRGEFISVVGKSGSGKSTLINMITGIDRPSEGEVVIDGAAIHKFNEGRMARWRGANMGVVFQFFQLLPTLTLVENIILPMDLCGTYPRSQRREKAIHLLEIMDLAKEANKLPSMISGGQQQRIAIARALANDPPVIVADEPTGSLDSKTANAVFELFERLVDEGKTFLMVTHDQELAQRTRRVITIADGVVVSDTHSIGTVRE
jgi:putative ABC transport system ATP-binding protein